MTLFWRAQCNRGLCPFFPLTPKRMRCWPFLLLGVLVFALTGVNKAQAAVPTFQAAGTAVASIAAVSPAWPVHAVDDIALLLVQTANEAVSLSTPAGFVQVANSPQGTGAAATKASTRLTVFWARATSTTMATPTVADSGNNQVAQIITFRGVIGTGNPWDVTAGDVLAAASTAFSIPGATTTVTNALVVAIVSNSRDATVPQSSGWTNADLSGVVEITDFNASVGNGGGFGAATGVKAAAGAYRSTTGSLANSSVQGRLSIALRPNATTLGDGSNPGNVTLAPGAAITDLDAFTLVTSSGTDSVTALTVTLTGTNSFESLSEVRITSNDGATTYFSAVANPASNTVSFSGGTAIPVTTTLTTFKVRITPKTHANMPIPPGLSYAIGGTVTAFTVTKEKLGSDAASATITVDNLSPAGATAVSGTGGDAQVTLNWTTSAATDFSRSVMLRWTGSSVGAQVPAEGVDYAVGNTIGTATVVCVRTADAASTAVTGVDGAATGGCSGTALTNGQAYSYRIFQKDLNGNYDTGVTVGTFTPALSLGGFNAYETNTAAGAISGVIKTKIAGTSFSLDLIAINSARTGILTTFTGTVKVEFLNSSSGGTLDGNGCNAGWPTIQTLATNPVFVAADNGRKTVSFQENNAWRNARVRISFPATGTATSIGCSNNNFAIRPNSLSFTVTDGDWETAGTTRTLNNASTPGGTVHKAGRPFTITATGYNGASTPAITSNYAGTPTASIASHLIPTSCLNGTACTLNGGTFTDGTANDGMVSSATASYAEVGAFNMQLADTLFADVDAADSTTTERYITSGTVAVGRFVPDHFSLTGGSRTPACTTGGAVLSYMSQSFTLAATLVAENFAGGTTENYHPSSGGYAPAVVVWQAENADSGTNLNSAGTRLTNVTGAWSKGSYVVNSTTATFNRLGSPDGPYDSLQLGTQLTDPDGPVLGALDMNAATSGACAPCTARTVGASISVRFGRLRLLNAYGSELLDLPIPIQTQYWSGVSFVTNTADSCTALAAGNVKLTAAPAGVAATVGGVFSSGVGSLTLSRPSPAASGAVGVCVDLGADPVGGTVCSATASANLPYLQGLWSPGTSYSNDPGARATFGIYKSPLIYRRENY